MEQGFRYSELCAAFKRFTRHHKDININVVYVDTLKREYACRSVLILSVDTLPQDQDNLVWLVNL